MINYNINANGSTALVKMIHIEPALNKTNKNRKQKIDKVNMQENRKDKIVETDSSHC